MVKHKLVPVEPTEEMLAEGVTAALEGISWTTAAWIYEAMLAAAPAVEQEPVGIEFPEYHSMGMGCGLEDRGITDRYEAMRYGWEEALDRMAEELDNIGPLYLHPQPAEQQPEPVSRNLRAVHAMILSALDRDAADGKAVRGEMAAELRSALSEQQPSAGDSLTSVPDEAFAVEFAAWWEEHGQFCRAGGGTYERSFAFEAWRHLYPQLMNLQMAAAEHQSGPDVADVAALVEALESQCNDLLAALEAIQKVNGPDFNGWHGSYDDAIDLARKAIKKARGDK